MSGNGARGPALDRIAVGPLPPESYTPTTTMTVEPAGLQWVGSGQQSIEVTATLRLDVDDALDQVAAGAGGAGGLDRHRRPGHRDSRCGSARR